MRKAELHEVDDKNAAPSGASMKKDDPSILDGTSTQPDSARANVGEERDDPGTLTGKIMLKKSEPIELSKRAL